MADELPAPSPSPDPSPENQHRGWYHRGYLPHFDAALVIQSITWRLADSVPQVLQEKLEQELASLDLPESALETRRRKKIEKLLDRGYGECLLRRKECASIVRDSLQQENGNRYHLHAWVIMPNHVHVLVHFMEGNPMGDVVEAWKAGTALKIAEVTGRSGALWQEDFWDRYMRDEKHYDDAIRYIVLNPVKAGLVKSREQWKWWWSARG